MRHPAWAVLTLAWLGLLVLPMSGQVNADDEYQKINYVRVGDKAPVFETVDDKGKKWQLKQHIGKKVIVMYFYMGDFFPNDKKQASAYRENMYKFITEGAEVVGISGDTVKSHQLFKETLGLNHTLLSDPPGKIGEEYGVSMSGGGEFKIKDTQGNPISIPRGSTPSRWTFVIGHDGKVIYKNTNVKPTQDPEDVLRAILKYKAARK
jgi:peroxiredoxin Q/BCP